VHVDRQGRSLQFCGVVARLGRLPALRVAEEDLHDIGILGRGRGQRILGADM